MPHNLTLALGTLSATPLRGRDRLRRVRQRRLQGRAPISSSASRTAQGETVYQRRAEGSVRRLRPRRRGRLAPRRPTRRPRRRRRHDAGRGLAAGADAAGAHRHAAIRARRQGLRCPPPTSSCRRCSPRPQRAPRIITAANAWLMDDIMARRHQARHRRARPRARARRTSAARPAPPTSRTTPGSTASTPDLEATVWVGFDQEALARRGRGRQQRRGARSGCGSCARRLRGRARRAAPGPARARDRAHQRADRPAGPAGRSATPSASIFLDKVPTAGAAPGGNPATPSGEPLF